jgi:glycosyltransferase involved in cell wall biosynthesis
LIYDIDMQSPFVTIFTPTYNRAAHLALLYACIKSQSFTSFEWIIVDDGSDDATAEVVNKFISESEVNITYQYQQNSGKHIAINNGIKLAAGELFFIVDSDDLLPEDSLSIIHNHWHRLLMDGDVQRFAGLCGLRAAKNGHVIGGNVDYSVLDASVLEYRYRKGYVGDKAEVYRTDVLRAYPFPSIEGEKFCTEALVWNRIGQSYQLRFFNERIYTCEYLPGGLSARSFHLRKTSPRYASLYYAELINTCELSYYQRIRAMVNFWRFALYNSKDKFSEKYRLINRPWSLIIFPVCYFLYCFDNLRNKTN